MYEELTKDIIKDLSAKAGRRVNMDDEFKKEIEENLNAENILRLSVNCSNEGFTALGTVLDGFATSIQLLDPKSENYKEKMMEVITLRHVAIVFAYDRCAGCNTNRKIQRMGDVRELIACIQEIIQKYDKREENENESM